MNCTPSSIIEASKCYCGLTAKEDSAVAIYLLCTWANQEGGPVTCGTPSDVIQISGAGSGDVNGIYVRNPILPNTYNSHDDAQAKIVVTAGNATIFYGLAGFERYYSTAEDFPCTWTIGPDGTAPVPTGQWLASPPVAWAPANEPVTWNDSGGAHVGDLPTFLATANFPSVNSLVFGATGNLTSLTGLKYLPSLLNLDCNTNALTSLDLTNLSALITLNCSSNASLTTLTLTGCTALTSLDCGLTAIVSLNCTGLVSLTSAQFSGNPSLTTIDLTGCSSYVNFAAVGIPSLSSVIFTGCASITDIAINFCGITSLDVTDLALLVNFDCSDNPITSVTGLAGKGSLVNVYVYDSLLTSIDISGSTTQDFECDGSPLLTSFNVTGCLSLKVIIAHGCALTTLTGLSTCTNLLNLDVESNLLTTVGVSTLTSIVQLTAYDNGMLTAGVDSILSGLVTAHLVAAGNADLGGTNQAPTLGINNVDKLNLEANGWSITVTP